MTVYIIKNKDNDQLFWHGSTNTWVETGEDFFSQQDRDTMTLPENGEWAVFNDPFGAITQLQNEAFALECGDDFLFTNHNGNLPRYRFMVDKARRLRKAMGI